MGDGERQFSTLKSTWRGDLGGIKATEAAVSEEFGLAPFLPGSDPLRTQPGVTVSLSGS
ncbi:hypothetical protein ACLB1E_05635 [Escherichia coli]